MRNLHATRTRNLHVATLFFGLLGGCALKQQNRGVAEAPSAGRGLGSPVASFPTKAELQSRPHFNAPPTELASANVVSVDSWELKSSIPAPAVSYGTQTRWDKLLVDALAGKDIAPSPALRCAAEEAARFFTVNTAYPDDRLQEFLVLRCGSSLINTGYGTLSSITNGTVPEERVEREMGAALRKLIGQITAQGASEMGLGYFQGAGKVSFVVFVGQKLAKLVQEQPAIDNDKVTISGELPKDSAYVMGLVTRGTNGFAHCEPDRAMLMPHFRVTCPIDEHDNEARVEVLAHTEKELLWNVTSRILVERDATANLAFRNHVGTNPAASGTSYTERLAAAINDARKRASRQEVQLLSQQSQADQDLTGYLHDAFMAHDREHLQMAALGMLAGWDVPGTIRDGGIYWFVQNASADPEAWVDRALDNPSGRWVLLDTDKSRLAVGTHPYGKSGILTVVSTYALFESLDHQADEEALFNEITALRRARGLPDPERVKRGAPLTEALAKIASRALRTDDAAQQLVRDVTDSSRQPTLVQVVEAAGVSQFPPPEVLFRRHLSLELGVTHYKAEGGAWGQYVFLFVLHNAVGSREQLALAQ